MMRRYIRPAFTTLALSTLLLGVGAPVAMTGIAQLLMPSKANGSLIEKDGQVIGSILIGQRFTEPRYFQPRPSAADYDTMKSAGSQLGPTSAALMEQVQKRVAEAVPQPVPADAVTASGSGLDPDISLENADRQVARVAAARNLPPERVRALLATQVAARDLGFLGEPRVNVLALNLALDALK